MKKKALICYSTFSMLIKGSNHGLNAESWIGGNKPHLVTLDIRTSATIARADITTGLLERKLS
jgi:hypothetical protein